MRIFFKSGGFKGQERGWYRFWTSTDASGNAMTFRMPESSTRDEVAKRAAQKLSYRKMDLNVKVRHATPPEVKQWMLGHRKKSGAITQPALMGMPLNLGRKYGG